MNENTIVFSDRAKEIELEFLNILRIRLLNTNIRILKKLVNECQGIYGESSSKLISMTKHDIGWLSKPFKKTPKPEIIKWLKAQL